MNERSADWPPGRCSLARTDAAASLGGDAGRLLIVSASCVAREWSSGELFASPRHGPKG